MANWLLILLLLAGCNNIDEKIKINSLFKRGDIVKLKGLENPKRMVVISTVYYHWIEQPEVKIMDENRNVDQISQDLLELAK